MKSILLLLLACYWLMPSSTAANATDPKSLTLAEALDQPTWSFTTGGSADWFPQVEETHDGEHAARSGNIDHQEQSWVETTVEGAGTLTFWWKVSSEETFDFLEFSINGVQEDGISGERSWAGETYTLGDGENLLRWRYVKDISRDVGDDAGWLDQIEFQPADPLKIEPKSPWEVTLFSSFPSSETRVFTLLNDGDEPIRFQASSSDDWVDFTNVITSLDAGESIELAAGIAPAASDLPVGIHETEFHFLNTTTGVEQIRRLSLTVLPAPGKVEVTDSISPADDHALPFGQLSVGVTRTETVRVRNTHPDNDLLVEAIQLRPVPEAASSQTSTTAEEPLHEMESAASFTTSDDQSSTDRPGTGKERPPRQPDWSRRHDPETLLVRFKAGAASTQRASAHDSLGTNVANSMKRIPLDVIQIPPQADLRAIQQAYQKNPAVEYAEPNYIVRIDETPDDPHFNELWALHNTGQNGGVPGADIAALEAWTWTQGTDEVIVGIIDTGIDYTHGDLAVNMWTNPNPTIGDVHGATWIGGDGVVTSGDPMDDHGHGTHVAGTVGAVGNNGIGVVGVNWNVRLMALKFLTSDGFGSTADAIAAIEYAIDHGAHLTNSSWGGTGFSQALRDMIAAAAEANQLFVAAAGNENSDNDTAPSYPASYDVDNIVSVASSTRSDDKSSFSNWGADTVHLAAPGSDILSTTPGDGYNTFSGTSMASPHVAGVAALLLSLEPSTEYARVKQAILDGVTPVPEWEDLVISGGRLSAAGALANSVKEFRIEALADLPVSLSPGRSLVFDAVYEPADSGPHEALLHIETLDAENPTINLQLNGAGVADALEVLEEEPFSVEGFAGGPFEPESRTYTLRNNGSEPLAWTVHSPAPWLTVSPTSGSLEPGSEVTVEVSINSISHDLGAGRHVGTVEFINASSGLVRERAVSLDVLPWPGQISVTDSTPPENDRQLPFGWVAPNDEKIESITLHNTHDENLLIVQDILLLGGYREDFDESHLLGWKTSPTEAWQLFGGNSYRAALSGATGFMQSTYANEHWFDASFEVELWRQGNTDTAGVLLLRASPDFDIERGIGTAMLIGISGNGSYYIARYIDDKFQWIQPWTESPHLNTGATPNVVVASMKNDQLHLFANDNLLWSGTAGGIFRPGRFGLAGFTSSDGASAHQFDYVDVREPLGDEDLPLTVSQSWYNAHPASPEESPAFFRAPAAIEPPPAGRVQPEEPLGYAEILARRETFRLPDLPALPFDVPPDSDFTLPVHFAPSGEGSYPRTLRILSNDPDEPAVDVLLSGSSEEDPLRLFSLGAFIADGEIGGPFTPGSVTYGLLNSGTAKLAWEIGDSPSWITTDKDGGDFAPGEVTDLILSTTEAAEELSRGTHTGAVEILNTETLFKRTLPVRIEVRPSLCETLMACDLTWTTGGDGEWFGQDKITRRTELSAQSGSIADNEGTWIETAVTGPGEVSFWWMVSSESGYDFLEFEVNGQRQAAISGEVLWEKKQYKLPEGTHTLRWTYAKDFIFEEGEDTGWLDEVVWTPTDPRRVIATESDLPFGVVSVGANSTRTLTVSNTGDATLSISDVSFPPGFSGNWTSATIPPGGAQDLSVTLSPEAAGEHGGFLEFTSDATSGPDKVQLSGFSVPAGESLEMSDGQVISGLAGAADEEIRFSLEVPDHRSSMEIEISGGTGDADLYVRQGAPPTLDVWDYAPFQVGNNEKVSISQPLGGTWHLLVHAYEDYSDVSITAGFTPLTFESWAESIGLPGGNRDLFDRHSPLNVTTLQAYAFGKDPRLLTSADLPRIERPTANPEQIRLVYRKQTGAEDVSILIETSPDLVDWKPASPDSESVVSESDGVQIREAIFGTSAHASFFIRATVSQP